MALYQLPIKNFEKQQQCFDATERFVIVKKGRRFGLTKGASNNFIKKALNKEFKQGLWVDTVNANIDRYVERYFIPSLKKLPPTMWNWQKQAKVLTILNSYIDFRSADRPENLEGFGYDYGFLNEAGIILKDEYLWNNAIKPMFWDFKTSRLVIGGAPKGKGEFFNLYQRGLDPEQKDFKCFSFSSFDNPYLDHQLLLEEIKHTPERVVRQEIYAEFLDDTGVVFRGVNAIATAEQQEPAIGHVYVVGCDLAKVQDFTVITVYDRSTNQQVYQMRFNKLDWAYQKMMIKNVSLKYNKALVLLDATGVGDPIYEDLARDGVPVEPIKFTNENKKQLIEKLANWIELKHIRILNLEETINELNSFTYEISSTGKVRYEAPVGFHDDIVISHALAIWSLQPLYIKEDDSKLGVIAKDLKAKTEDFNKSEDDLFFEVESV